MKGNMGHFGEPLGANFFTSILGDSVSQLTDTIKTSATQAALNITGAKLASDPSSKQMIIDSTKESSLQVADMVWNDYKIPIVIIGGAIAISMILGVVVNPILMSKRK